MGLFKQVNWLSVTCNVVLTGAIAISCVSAKNMPSPNPRPHIDTAVKNTKDVQKGILGSADRIDGHVDTVREQVKKQSPKVVQIVTPSLDGIKDETGVLRELKGKLDATITELNTVKELAAQLQVGNEKLAEKVAKLEEEKRSALNKLMTWVILGSILGLGISASALWTGKPWGIASGVGCIASIAGAVLVTQYSAWIALGAGGVALAAIAYSIFQFVGQKKTSKELVETVEAAKMAMRAPARHYLFGNGPIPGQVDNIQKSSATKQFVRKMRSNGRLRLAPSVTPSLVVDGQQEETK